MASNFKHSLLGLVLTVMPLHAPPALAAVTGVYPDRIVVGQSAALSGPSKALGVGMQAGLQAAFTEINESGGVNGRLIELLSLDDGYEPERAIDNTRQLINEDGVFALIGAVGTPTSKAAQPMAKKSGIPFVGPFTGASFLRDPQNTHVINVRGSYDQETETAIQRLTTDLDASRIAILYQDDSFGRAGLSGVKTALQKRNLSLIAIGKYERNSIAVKSALLKIRKSNPDAIIMVGSYQPVAKFVKLARKLQLKTQFLTLSFVGSKALYEELGNAGEGVIVTQVMPFHDDEDLPLIKDYHQALQRLDATAKSDFVSLEGYLVGRLFIEALQRVGPELSPQAFIDVFQKKPVTIDIGGVKLSYGPNDNQGMDKVYLSILQADGSFNYVNTLKTSINTAERP